MERKLYYSGLSPYARAARILLSELELDYSSDRLDKMRPVENISAINPNLTIPVLKDDEKTLFDSAVICEYLLEIYGKDYKAQSEVIPLFVHRYRPKEKWNDLKLLATIETLTEALVSIFLFRNSIEASGANPEKVSYLTRHTTRVSSILDWLNQHPVENGFYPGYFTLLDINLICALGMCSAVDLFDWKDLSTIDQLMINFRGRQSVIETTP